MQNDVCGLVTVTEVMGTTLCEMGSKRRLHEGSMDMENKHTLGPVYLEFLNAKLLI